MPREIITSEAASRKIKARRIELGFTQAQLAELLGVSREWYNKMENDPYCMPVSRLYDIAAILKCKVSLFILP